MNVVIVFALFFTYAMAAPQPEGGGGGMVIQKKTDQSINGGQGNVIQNNEGISGVKNVNQYGNADEKILETVARARGSGEGASSNKARVTDGKSVAQVEQVSAGSSVMGP
jgi:hypothetical protein